MCTFFSRVEKAKVRSLFGHQAMGVALKTRVTVMVMPTVFIPYPSRPLQKKVPSPGIWKNAHPPLLPLTAVGPITKNKL